MNLQLSRQCILLRSSIIVCLFTGTIGSTMGQVASIEKTLTTVQNNVSRVNQLADNNDIYSAIDLLNTTRRDFDSYISHFLEDEFRNARTENKTYIPRLSLQFSQRLTASFWEARVRQSERALTNAKEAFAARNHQRTLNSQDLTWSYLKSVYTIASTIKDVTENLIKQNYIGAAQSAYEGTNDFIENYKEMEDARLQIINTERYEIEVQQLIKRAERMEEKNWQFASFMQAYEQDVTDFQLLVDRFNSFTTSLANEPANELDEQKVSWNSEPYLPRIVQKGNQYEKNNQDYASVEKEIRGIISEAENRKTELSTTIKESGSPRTSSLLEKLEEEYDEFYNLALDVIDNCYRISKTEKQTQSQPDSSPQQQGSFFTSGTGQRAPNKLYHSYWSHSSGNKMKLIQEGQQVVINGRGTGTILNGVLTYSYQDTDGSRTTDEYRLLEDGYTLEEKREWSTQMIKDHLTVLNNFTAPSAEKIAEFRKANPGYITTQWKYAGGVMAMYNDTDRDQVPDDMDGCRDTPEGLTVSNGGVDIRGCTLDSRNSQVSDETAVSQSTTVINNTVNNNSTSPEQQKPPTTQPQGEKSDGKTQSDTQGATTQGTDNSPLEPKRIGRAINKNKAGASLICSVPVYHLKENETLVFKLVSGTFEKFYVYWTGVHFNQEYIKETKEVVYSTADLLADRPEKAMFLYFHMNQYSATSCTMEAWVLPRGVSIPTEWNIPVSSSTGKSTNNRSSDSFDEFIRKADEAFNRNYWEESGQNNSAANPKQESLNWLLKCEPLVRQEQNNSQKYLMMKRLSGKYSDYAKRVFAYTAKEDFIQRNGKLLSEMGSQAQSLPSLAEKASAYQLLAEAWRNLTVAATWGNHAYNKAYCDRESKKYYELALREDTTNAELKKTVEKINTPKRPIPAAVANTSPIPESKWATAENMRNSLTANKTDYLEHIAKVEKPNYLMVGHLTLETNNGDVEIKQTGSTQWETISTPEMEIYPGDQIRTGATATKVFFRFDSDRSLLAIRPGSTVTIFEEHFYIERGGVFVRVVKKGKRFLVITPTAVTGPRGTEFSVYVDAGNTNVNLYDGIVEIRTNNEISFLEPGESASVKNDDPIVVEKFDAAVEKNRQWPQLNPSAQDTSSGIEKDIFHAVSGGFTIMGSNR